MVQAFGFPFLAGGFVLFSPSVLKESGSAERLDGAILAPATQAHHTCKSRSAFYFFIGAQAFARLLDFIAAVTEAKTNPHLPVRLCFHAVREDLCFLTFVRPPALSVETVCGPPPPPQWSGATAAAAHALRLARTASWREAVAALDKTHEIFADTAEHELVARTGTPLRVVGKWGRMTSSKLVAPWDDARPRSTRVDSQLLAFDWSWLSVRLRDLLAQAAAASTHLDCDDNAIPPGAGAVELLQDTVSELLHDGVEEGSGDADFQLSLSAVHRLAEQALLAIADGQWGGAALEAWNLEGEELSLAVGANADHAVSAHNSAASQSWNEWAALASEKGGKRMHKVCAVQLPWQPFTVLSVDGFVTADPAMQLSQLAAELEPFWRSSAVAPPLKRRGGPKRAPLKSRTSLMRLHFSAPPRPLRSTASTRVIMVCCTPRAFVL